MRDCPRCGASPMEDQRGSDWCGCRDDRVFIRRFTGEGVRDVEPAAIVAAMLELGPEGGDFVVLRAMPGRAEAIESGLHAQLFAYGALLAGESVEPDDGER